LRRYFGRGLADDAFCVSQEARMRHCRYLNRTEAAQWLTERGLRCSPRTLAKYATVGGGPIYRRYGNRTVYTEDDLGVWAESRMGDPLGHPTAEAA
jgi:hypothetical protein